MMKSLSALGMIAAATLFCATPLSLHWSPAKSPSLSVDTADARVGRPLTPMSVAGVAGARTGAEAFALVGTDPTFDAEAGSHSQGGWFQVAVGYFDARPLRLCNSTKINASCCPPSHLCVEP